jgi:hypothetical protein
LLEWFPTVFVDLHEMGSDRTYYFAPTARPWNRHLLGSQDEWHEVFGRNNAKWFDRFRFDYFTREVFDSYYPGYGESWPMFHGAIGMTLHRLAGHGRDGGTAPPGALAGLLRLPAVSDPRRNQ